ncbi:MAG: hypothetical protein CVT48_05040 [Thermoplasmata archaeon HGW-Thermoplasmata-1]|nr:MAG: hypothetical protein CVT48_05040 [Thermoplasmata archaeon HGW-Thermoplasmata-1]
MRIGIIYNTITAGEARDSGDVAPQNEVLDIVDRVKSELELRGHAAIPIKLCPDALPMLRGFDVIFNFAEGMGPDLSNEPFIPAYLDLFGIAYTGCPSFALQICGDKPRMKKLLEAEGIPTPRSQFFRTGQENLDRGLTFPLIVKPSAEHASIGIGPESVVENEDELRKRAAYIIETYEKGAIAEEYIGGREINAALLEDMNGAVVLPISEIVFELPDGLPRIVAYEAKWIEESVYYKGTMPVCPAVLEEWLFERITELAKRCFEAVGARDYARVDFRVRGNEVFVIDINPNPSIAPACSGLVCGSLAAAGIGYGELIERLLELAVSRKIEKKGEGVKTERFSAYGLDFRTVVPEDAPLLAKWFNDRENTAYMDGQSEHYDSNDLFGRIMDSKDRDFIVETDGRPIGFASIYDIDEHNGNAEFSVIIGENADKGKGYGKKIVRWVTDYAFNELGLVSVFVSITVENIASIKAVKAAGLKEIGLRRKYHRVGDRFADDILFDMTDDEYRAMH